MQMWNLFTKLLILKTRDPAAVGKTFPRGSVRVGDLIGGVERLLCEGSAAAAVGDVLAADRAASVSYDGAESSSAVCHHA